MKEVEQKCCQKVQMLHFVKTPGVFGNGKKMESAVKAVKLHLECMQCVALGDGVKLCSKLEQ